METQISTGLPTITFLLVIAVAALYNLVQQAISPSRMPLPFQPQSFGQQRSTGWNLGTLFLIAVLAAGGVALISEVQASSAAPATSTLALALQPPEAPVQTQSQTADPMQQNAREMGAKTLQEFFGWRANALRTRDWRGIDQFLTGNARIQMIASLAKLQTENCYWQEGAPQVMVGMARMTQLKAFSLSANFDEQATLYCDGYVDARSFFRPTRIGTTLDFVKVGDRWLIQDASAMNQLVGMPLTVQE
ncbi:MAG: DUF4101 domain-containing protein [Chloroflexi bacterium]|nr:DUF4101 domain-containing protein [Chloroflexota bacterium]